MKEKKERPTYYSYLLHLHWLDNSGQPAWRVSLHKPGNESQMFFDSLAALCAYLTNQLGLDNEGSYKEEKNL